MNGFARRLLVLSAVAPFLVAGCGHDGESRTELARGSSSLGSPSTASSPAYKSTRGPRQDATVGGEMAVQAQSNFANPVSTSAGMGRPGAPSVRDYGKTQRVAAPAAIQPNFYINSTYMGGTGAKDR